MTFVSFLRVITIILRRNSRLPFWVSALAVPFPNPLHVTNYVMGVHGLTTYLHENQRVLSKTVLFHRPDVSDGVVTTIVVDGWS